MIDLPENVQLRIARGTAAAPPGMEALSRNERLRLTTFGSATRRGCFLLGRATLRGLLAEYLGLEPAEVQLRSAPDGALEVAEAGLHVSLAHTTFPETGDGNTAILAAAAVADRPIGIDVEAFKPRRPDLYRRILNQSEYPLLDTLGVPRDQAQIVLWTIKEAALKAGRMGLRVGMRNFSLSLAVEQAVATCTLPDGQGFDARYAICAEYVIAVAVAR